MAIEKDMQNASEKVDAAFMEFFGGSHRGRIKLAAFAVGEQVGILRGLMIARDKRYSEVPSASQDSISIFSLLFIAHVAPAEQKNHIPPKTHSGETTNYVVGDDAIQVAELALKAALDRAQAVYGLNERQVKKAHYLADRSFWLFNTADPSQE